MGHPVVDAARDQKEDGEDHKREHQPLAARDAVGEEDEAGAARDGGQRHGQQVLLGLLDKRLVDGVARLGRVRLPRRQPVRLPARHERSPARQRRVPAVELRPEANAPRRGPQVGENAAVVEAKAVEGNVEEEPRHRSAEEIVPVLVLDEVRV